MSNLSEYWSKCISKLATGQWWFLRALLLYDQIKKILIYPDILSWGNKKYKFTKAQLWVIKMKVLLVICIHDNRSVLEKFSDSLHCYADKPI